MRIRDYVIHSQLAPPRNQQGILSRPRLSQTILKNTSFPLLIIQAGTGYGKSTELVKLSENLQDYYWVSIQEQDRDPFLFLAKLFSAFSMGSEKIGENAIQVLESDQRINYPELITLFINDLSKKLTNPTYLILDDFHHVLDQNEIEQIFTSLVDNSPANFHLIVSTRRTPTYKAMNRWKVKNQLKILSRSELAFTQDEIKILFAEKFRYPLSEQQAELIYQETEGWAIALQIVWQSIQQRKFSIEQVFTQRPTTLDSLFAYLANEVLNELPEDLQKFLITSSVLDIIEIDACNMLMGNKLCLENINRLFEKGLFINSLGEKTFQYQNLFHDFLKMQLKKDQQHYLLLNKKCADYFENKKRIEAAIYHLLEAKLFNEVESKILSIAQGLINVGRLDTLLQWIEQLPESLVNDSSELQFYLGEVKRIKSDFEGSLIHFQNAERLSRNKEEPLGISKALRGKAQIYLDTIRPLKAEVLLEEALKILDPQEYKSETAALFDQLAENKLNLGHPDIAQELHHEAKLLRNEDDQEDSYLEARSMLRTGRLEEGKNLLVNQLTLEKSEETKRPQRFHRETSLLLSLIYIFQGNWELAKEIAEDGIRIGQQLNSIFVEAVGYIRLGHAYELQGIVYRQQKYISKAIQCYQTAIEKVKTFKVTRVQVEPLWGLSRSYGFQGNIFEAQKYAQEALKIADQSGDRWLCCLTMITLGASHFISGQIQEAQEQFIEAIEGCKQVFDSFGLAASLMWSMICYWYGGNHAQALDILKQLIPLIKAGNYSFLLTKPTYLGVKDAQILLPIFIAAYHQKIDRTFIEQLLFPLKISELDYHPGYQLNIQSLGLFEVWRGDIQIRSNDWQREKAKKIFQLMLIHRNEWLNRELIIDRLWPDLSPEAAIRDFKVALNALNKALEPERPKGSFPFFIIRNDNLYSINPHAKIWWDAELFDYLAQKDDLESLETARAMYKGDFFPDNLYDDWTINKRDQIKKTYLNVLEKLTLFEMDAENYDQAIRYSDEIIRIDPIWESAYRNLMVAYAKKENYAQVSRVYQRLKKALSEEINVLPSEITESLYAELIQGNYQTK